MAYQPRNDRFLIVALAVAVRGLVAWVFLGPADPTGAQLVSWIGRILATSTALPLGFCFKLFPLVFDALLALLVYDHWAADRQRALRAGLLYALAPVALLVVAIGYAPEAIGLSLLLLSLLLAAKDSRQAAVLAGAMFGLSIFVTPLALPFVLLLLSRRRAMAFLGGMCGVLAVCLLMRAISGAPIRFDELGAPVWTLLPPLLFAPLHWSGRLTRERTVLLAVAAMALVAGPDPARLLWLLPVLLICGEDRFAAVYSLLAGLYLIIRGHHPFPYEPNVENMAAFAPLHGLAWLAPSATFLEAKASLYLLLGDLALPAAYVYLIVRGLVHAFRGQESPAEPLTPLSIHQLVAPAAIALSLMGIVATYAATRPRPTTAAFAAVVRTKAEAYAAHRYTGPGRKNQNEPTWVIPAYARGVPRERPKPVDAVSIGYAAVLFWSAAAWLAARRDAAELTGQTRGRVLALASAVTIAAILTCHVAGVARQLSRIPHVDEVEYLHAGYLMHQGLRVYRDFFEHHAPYLFQLLATLVPEGRLPDFPLLDVPLFIARGRAVAGLLGTVAALAAAGLAWRISRSALAPAVVLAALLGPVLTWYRGLTDIRNEPPTLAFYWIGAWLLMERWSTPRRAALAAGTGIGLAFLSALWNPKWPFACFFLGALYLVRLWRSWREGPRILLYALTPAGLLIVATLVILTRSATLTDYILFTYDYTMRLARWWRATTETHILLFFPTPLRFCPPVFKGPYPFIAAAAGIALMAMRRLRERFDPDRLQQLAVMMILAVLAALEVRFIAPYPNVWSQNWMMWCFVMAILYGTVAGLLQHLVPERGRIMVTIAALVLVFAAFIQGFERRLRPLSRSYDPFVQTASRIQKGLGPADTVWLTPYAHPIGAKDAHYIWFGQAEHIPYLLDAQARGDLPPYLPHVTEAELPPCRAARGEDRHVRFVMKTVSSLEQTDQCVAALLAAHRAEIIARSPDVVEIRPER